MTIEGPETPPGANTSPSTSYTNDVMINIPEMDDVIETPVTGSVNNDVVITGIYLFYFIRVSGRYNESS